MTITVVIADDEPLIRAGIRMLLGPQSDIEVVAEAADGLEAVVLARTHCVDVVLMDLRMPNMDGIEATRVITADEQLGDRDHLIKVLVLTTLSDDEAVYGALRAGASGFLLKHAAPRDLLEAVRHVAGGEAWIDPSIAGKVITALGRLPLQNTGIHDLVEVLTRREREILTLMALGLDNTEIKNQLFVSEATVKTHVARIIMKTGSRNRTQAVVVAYQSGLVRP